jgi:transcription-repair coupling factor (superfamily II helicase)
MTAASLIGAVLKDAGVEHTLHELLGGGPRQVSVTTGLRPALIACHARQAGHPSLVLVVTAGSAQASSLTRQLKSVLGERVFEFRAWETLLHEPLRPSPQVVAMRASTLAALNEAPDSPKSIDGAMVLVTSVRSFLQPVFTEVSKAQALLLRVGEQVPREPLLAALIERGFERVDLVQERGEFAVRGSIIDLFVPVEEHPTRLQFDDDTIEEIRSFSIADQRSLETLSAIAVWPCQEQISADYDQLIDLLPTDSDVVILDPERVRARAEDLITTDLAFKESNWQTSFGDVSQALVTGERPELEYFDLSKIKERVLSQNRGWFEFTPFHQEESPLDSSPSPAFRGDVNELLSTLRKWLSSDWQVFIALPAQGAILRMKEFLEDNEIDRKRLTLWQGVWQAGFVLGQSKLALLTETDIFGKGSNVEGNQKMPTRRKGDLDPLTLTRGEWLVHYQHGVGRFQEVISREVAGATREYLVVEYAANKRGMPADLLYVPTDQLHMISKYVGGETPSPSKLGGGDWQKTKSRARKAVKDIADQLVRLYAIRAQAKGTQFSPDTPWQRELEDAFVYVETPDQLVCVDEVKADMQRPMPMDRVVAGDVGYGKTEIAVRAAFKAVQDGKQVAVLVPTTLLVQQHLNTFTDRYAGFPVKVKALSRFLTDKEASEVLAALAESQVDVIIGTHRLLTPKVKFHDLGLVIVDEEQRFGVEHKEFLKALRTNVDVLTLSATPIPRTLEMALTGIRDLSVIQTPPEERLPVLTYVGPYQEAQVAAAIRRELVRDGQVFFVHNRVDSIDRTANRLAELVPEARIAVGHGQMPEATLEQVVLDFWAGDIDVLVCTTIVESGLDISNANTLIVDSADKLGLAQLHQLRGRVGRSRERAHAYFFYPPEASLNESAYERLSTIAQHNELGAGMAVAMKDLEIRGAGNLLGGEQSGHIADVGFDLYVRLVSEALAAAKGEESVEMQEIRIDLPLAALLPNDYIAEERLRLDVYRRLGAATSDGELATICEELQDRFGPLPIEARLLFEVGHLKNIARGLGIRDISSHLGSVRISPITLRESTLMRIQRLYPGTKYRNATQTLVVSTDIVANTAPEKSQQLIRWLESFLNEEVGTPVAA